MSDPLENEARGPIATQQLSTNNDESTPESPIRRTRLLSEVYEHCNYTSLELDSFVVASKEEFWLKAMQEEIKMKLENWLLN